ncbi:hypothetical protein FA95DRAFT_1602767 [Auriscalpium vulgare]|uniref:Uncharacterized protein n=1 Tax=Auriscalpium vulgare TaxID=40419 RepID=A0ACB8S557_9AGAM|nr:hypothetical protein FA95DRAFT_1602767 [Auriscalpium vulgare]
METLLPDPFVGRCGSVFRTQVTHLADADGNPIALDTVVMPELVLKVARRARRPFLAHEAWFYEEMESLQGVTVPRCYGYFHGELQSGLSVNMKGWLESWPHQLNWFDEPGNTRVCVLLLERVGGLTEPGQKPFPHREDLVDAMEDLTCLSIVHGDIRWENILHATPDSSVASASTGAGIMCPRHQVIHHYRFIDFEDAYRTNMLKQRIQEDAKDHLDHLLDMMEDGFVRD